MIYLILENSTALLALPTELKMLLLAAFLITFVYGVIRKLWKIVKLVLLIAVIYFALTYFGVI